MVWPLLSRSFFFAFIFSPTRAMQTAPGDKGWKQEANAARWRRTFERQSVRCGRERRLQEREPLQSRRALHDRKVEERSPQREGPGRAAGTARQQGGF